MQFLHWIKSASDRKLCAKLSVLEFSDERLHTIVYELSLKSLFTYYMFYTNPNMHTMLSFFNIIRLDLILDYHTFSRWKQHFSHCSNFYQLSNFYESSILLLKFQELENLADFWPSLTGLCQEIIKIDTNFQFLCIANFSSSFASRCRKYWNFVSFRQKVW